MLSRLAERVSSWHAPCCHSAADGKEAVKPALGKKDIRNVHLSVEFYDEQEYERVMKCVRLQSGVLPFLVSMPILFILAGCMGELACRHQALEHASLGVEKNLETRISIYKVNHPTWDAHAQAQVKIDGKWKWMTEWYGYVFIKDEPTYEPAGYVLFYSIPEYLEVLKKGSYATGEGPGESGSKAVAATP